jgi:hypothetical protein
MTPGDEVWELCFDPAAVRWSITPKSHARQLA